MLCVRSQDVAWHNHNAHVFGSVGDDKQLIVWDTRQHGESHLLKDLCWVIRDLSKLFQVAVMHLGSDMYRTCLS